MTDLLLFTDLDGTLLDPETYSWERAASTLGLLRARSVPLVFCSSKTLAEQLALQEAMGIREPAVAENGSVVAIPAGYFRREPVVARRGGDRLLLELGLPVREVRERLAQARRETGLPFRGYGEMSLAEVRRLTGLDEEGARRATARQYSETILPGFPEREWERFRQALAKRGLVPFPGGRLCTVTSAGADKGKAAALVTELYRRDRGAVITAGVGDSPNDAPMLGVVDRPFLVQRPRGGWAPVEVPGLVRVEAPGPEGWAEAVRSLLETPTPAPPPAPDGPPR